MSNLIFNKNLNLQLNGLETSIDKYCDNVYNQGINILINGLNSFSINRETYFFNRRMKSRFFNQEEEDLDNLDNDNFKSLSTNSNSSQYSYNEKQNYKNDKEHFNNQNMKKQKEVNKNKKNCKKFKERKGDWTCFYCKNLNFSFRNECNKCNIKKKKSDEGHDNYFQRILNQIILNEEKRKNFNCKFNKI